MFACDHETVTPDLMAVSKGLTGGYLPLGATLSREEIYRGFLGDYGEWKTFFHGHSYTGNPLGCAIALANLDVLRKERRLATVRKQATLLARLLKPLARLAHVGDIRQCAYMVGIELVQHRQTKTPYPLTDRMGHRVTMAARQRGLMIRPIGNVVILMPPLVTTAKELVWVVDIVRDAIVAVTERAAGEGERGEG